MTKEQILNQSTYITTWQGWDLYEYGILKMWHNKETGEIKGVLRKGGQEC